MCVSYECLCKADRSSGVVLSSMACLCVIEEPQKQGVGPLLSCRDMRKVYCLNVFHLPN